MAFGSVYPQRSETKEDRPKSFGPSLILTPVFKNAI